MTENDEKYDRRGKSKNPRKLRNLPQYKDMSDEELEMLVAKKENNIQASEVFEKEIEKILAQFEEDYDLSDMKINDRAVLRGLAQSIVSLEWYEQQLFKMRGEGIDGNNVLAIQKLQNVMSELRQDISRMQTDLSITRKHRKSDQETSVLAYIDSLKDKARRFMESKQAYILCPKCSTLLMTTWSLYPSNPNNKITLTCLQKDKDGKPCNTRFTISTKEMLENKQSNRPEILPESLS